MNEKVNPRWQNARFQVSVSDKHGKRIPDHFPVRFETAEDGKAFLEHHREPGALLKYAVPWLLKEQPDGTWKESF